MADPATLAIIGMGTGAAGSIIQGIGAQGQGASQAAMFNYQAGTAQISAQLAKQDANYATAAGEVEAQQSGMRTRSEVGQTRAAFGASNVTGGSQDAVLKSEHDIGVENEELIRSNAAKRAYGFNVEAAKDTAQSSVYANAASTSKTAGTLGMISSLIGGASNVSSKWLQYGQSFGSSGGPIGDSPIAA